MPSVLFMVAAVTLAAVPVQATILRRRERRTLWRPWVAFLAAAGLPAVVFVALAGTLGGGDRGFVFYSMNLLSPFWPQRSGLFGAGLPIVDATGGQYEGFCYLGAGTLLLLAAALPRLGRLRRWPGLVAVLGGLTLIALSSRVYLGPVELLDLGAKPWEDLFAMFRASGRAFWPVGYALAIAAVAAACLLPRRARLPLLAAAIVLQIIDTTPLRHAAEAALAGETGVAGALPALPVGGTLLTVVPTPGCGASPAARAIANPLLLAGMRAGMRLGNVGLGRSPAWFSCEAILSDALELPLLPDEVRVFTDAEAQAPLRPALLGPTALCQSETTGAVVCARDLAMPPGVAVPPGPGPGLTPIGTDLAGPTLQAVLGSGWRAGPDGAIWSEGPRATLVFRLPEKAGVVLTLHVAGFAQKAGGIRRVAVTAGRVPVATLELPDGAARDVSVPIPADASAGGILRLAFDMRQPVDPAKRGLAAPVRRAGLRVDRLRLGYAALQ